MNREQQRQELESKLETVIMQDASYTSTVKMCADIAQQYAEEYANEKIKEVHSFYSNIMKKPKTANY